MNPTQQPLDSSIVALAQSISKTETGGSASPYTQGGKSGEYGAYQYTAPTWAADSQKYLGQNIPLDQATPAQQDEVAYNKIKALGTEGYTPAQIASIWNSGKPDPTGNVGVNKYGVAYNTPAYVSKVESYYNQFNKQNSGGSTGNIQPAQTPGTPPVAAATPADPAGVSGKPSLATAGKNLAALPGQLLSAGKSLLPAIPDIYNDVTGQNTGANHKTALQQAGDLGTTALTVGSVAAPELGLGDAGILAKISGNAALGAGFGASGALSAGDTNAGQIATQAGIGAGTGGLLGAATGAVDNLAAKTTESRLGDLANKSKAVKKVLDENSSATTNPIKTVLETTAENGKPLAEGLKVNDQGRVDAEALTNEKGTGSIDGAIESHAQQVSDLVRSLPGPGISTADFKSAVEESLKNDPSLRGKLNITKDLGVLDSKMKSAGLSYGATIPWTGIDEIRMGMNSVYDPADRDVARVIGDTARALLKNGSPERSAIRGALDNESELIKARNFIQKINGMSVGKGQLGKMFSELIGSGAGGAIGSIGGPVGSAAGVVGGKYTADAIENMLSGHYFKPLGSGVAGDVKGLLNSKTGGAIRAGLLRASTKL